VLRRTRALLVLPVLLAALAGCGESGSGTAAPRAEAEQLDTSKLVVYSGRQEALVDPLLKQFEADTGVGVSVRYGDSAELAAQLLEEGERTEADVFLSQDAGALGALAEQGLLAEMPSTLLNRVAEPYRDPDGRWVGVTGRARVLVYNSEKVPAAQLPDSVFDLTDERWNGQIGVAPTNASFQAFVTGMRLTAGEERTREFLSALEAGGVNSYANNIEVLNAVDRGEISAGLINHYYWYEKAAEEGADSLQAKLHYFGAGDPGALVNVSGVGLLAGSGGATPGSGQAEQAQQFVDYLLSPPGQRHFAERVFEYPLVAGTPTPTELPPLASLRGPDIDLSDLRSLDETLALLDEVGLS